MITKQLSRRQALWASSSLNLISFSVIAREKKKNWKADALTRHASFEGGSCRDPANQHIIIKLIPQLMGNFTVAQTS